LFIRASDAGRRDGRAKNKKSPAARGEGGAPAAVARGPPPLPPTQLMEIKENEGEKMATGDSLLLLLLLLLSSWSLPFDNKLFRFHR